MRIMELFLKSFFSLFHSSLNFFSSTCDEYDSSSTSWKRIIRISSAHFRDAMNSFFCLNDTSKLDDSISSLFLEIDSRMPSFHASDFDFHNFPRSFSLSF